MPGVLVENFDGFAPGRGLRRADIAQIQDVALHNAAGPEAMVLDDAPMAVRLAILLPPGLPQKHDAENLARGIRRGDRGRSSLQRFSAILPQDSHGITAVRFAKPNSPRSI